MEFIKQYKMYFLIGLSLVYSIGLWHVASTYTKSSWQAEKIALQQKAIETQQDRQALANLIGVKIDTAIGNIHINNTTINREVEHEITKEPVYTDCVTTPNGVQLIESAIDNKGQSTSK